MVVDALLDGAIEGAPKHALNDLRKDANNKAITKFEKNQTIVNILDFQLFLIMFNSFNDTGHNKASHCLNRKESNLQCSANSVSIVEKAAISTAFKEIDKLFKKGLSHPGLRDSFYCI